MGANDKRVVIDRFVGLNLEDTPGSIGDNELVRCENFNLTPNGSLVKRTGMPVLVDVGSSTTLLLGHFQTADSAFDQVLFRHGNDLYKYEAGAATFIGTFGDMSYGLQYENHFYIIRKSDTILDWNGTTATAIPVSPPGTVAIVYKDRMFVGNSSDTNPGRLFFSDVADFSTAGWNGGATFFDINLGDGDVITGLAIIHDSFMVFKMRSSWFLNVVADVTAWASRSAAPDVGCVSPYTIRQYEGFIYFVSPFGAYKTDGYTFDCISEKVSSTFLRQENADSKANLSAAALWEDKYIVLLRIVTKDSNGTETTSYKIMVYHIKVQGWTEWVTENLIFNFLELPGAVGLRGLIISSRAADGRLYRYGQAGYVSELIPRFDTFDFSDASGNYVGLVTTKDFNFGDVGLAKRSKLIQIEYQGSTPNTKVFRNGDIVDNAPGIVNPVVSSGLRVVSRTGPVGWFNSLQLEFTAVASTESCFLYSFVFQYKAASKPFIHS